MKLMRMLTHTSHDLIIFTTVLYKVRLRIKQVHIWNLLFIVTDYISNESVLIVSSIVYFSYSQFNDNG